VRFARPRSRSQISGGSDSIRASRSSVISRRCTSLLASPAFLTVWPGPWPAAAPGRGPRAPGA
jgi:hypothetical protein